ncbi:MAG: hypothetical protein ACI906_002501 [Candidatus Latescibacterota bacterium]|jgi:hypothetical protein
MKKYCALLALLLWAPALSAQQTGQAAPAPQEGWDTSTTTSLSLGQMSFNSNWAAGGTDVFSANGNVHLAINHLTGIDGSAKTAFVNTVNLNYGIQKAEGFSAQKSVDDLKASSMMAYRLGKDLLFGGDALYVGATVSLYTQMAPGYILTYVDGAGQTAYYGIPPNIVNNPNTGASINPRKGLKLSSFMSPGYVWTRAGIRYLFQIKGQDAIFFQVAPLAMKQTYVLDSDIRLTKENAQNPDLVRAFDIYGTRGKRLKTSAGATVDFDLKLPLSLVSAALQNISLATDNVFFFSYKDPGLDLMSTFALQGQINQYISANLTSNIIYNGNTDTDLSQSGTQTGFQFMSNLGIGLTLKF